MRVKYQKLSPVSLGLTLFFFSFSFWACARFPDINTCSLDETGNRHFVGKGTSDNPYILCTYEDLRDKLQDANNLSSHFAMYANIDARESWAENPPSGMTSCIAFDGNNQATATCEGWEPVGDDTTPFTGSFDGRGQSISNLWIKRDISRMGFFGVLGNSSPEGDIRNLALLDIDIQGGSSSNIIGALVGRQDGGTITNSYATGEVNAGANDDIAGVLVGGQSGGMITNSYVRGDTNGESGDDSIGALVGYQDGGTTTNSYATGEANGGIGIDRVGGLIGQQLGGTITNSYALGDANGGNDNDEVGGLVGQQHGDITNSYAVGSVEGGSGVNDVGGFVGNLGTGSAITGTNYYFDNPMGSTNGIGNGACIATVCIQEMDANFTTIFGALFSTMGWDNAIWSSRDGHPCLLAFGGPGNGCPPP